MEVHEFDPNNKETWPDEAKVGKTVLCKFDIDPAYPFGNGVYPVDVVCTSNLQGKYPSYHKALAWMEIPKELKDFKPKGEIEK